MIALGGGVAQLLERRTRGSMTSVTRVRTPSGAQEKRVSFFPSLTNVVLTRYLYAACNLTVYTHA